MTKHEKFHGLRTPTGSKMTFQKHCRCADAHCGKADMARRTCFREQYYTGMREISVAGKTAGNIRRKLYVKIGWFFFNISGFLYSFGLALFVVQDIYVFLQWIPAGGPGKSLSQRLGEVKVSRLMTKNWEFHSLRTLADRKMTFQKHFRCADAHCGSPDMARRTCFREQYYTGMREISEAGKTAGNIRRKLYMIFGWFFINFSGYMCSFGLTLFVVQDICVFLQWIPAGGLGKSLGLGQGLATDNEKLGISWFDDVCGQQNDVSDAFSLC